MSEKPKRIQRKRTKGWKMPPNTVYVGRPTKWGNPFSTVNGDFDREQIVKRFRSMLTVRPSLLRHKIYSITKGMNGRGEGYVSELKDALPELRGKNLACWCPLDQPCHSDVLLELANKESTP